MEEHVGGADVLPAQLGRRPLGAVDRVAECGERPAGGSGPLADRGALDEAAQAVQVDHVIGGEPADENAAVELVDQQSLVGQQAERLPQGVARDAEGRTDRLLRQAGAGLEHALDDALAQDGRHALGRAGAPEQNAILLETLGRLHAALGHDLFNPFVAATERNLNMRLLSDR